jgi:hypothetical protein
MTDRPRIIALCGHPGSGKSTAQKILNERFGAINIDDGWPMRDFAIRHLGWSLEDVTTQEGKAEIVEFAGKEFQRRWLLGELGNAIEALLGPDVIPLMAARGLEPGRLYCAGSVRREQGNVWKRFGALIIKIDNPVAESSPYEFDRFNEALVDITIENHGLAWGHSPSAALDDLTEKLDAIMFRWFGLNPNQQVAA